MKHNKKRISKIVDELINFFFKIGAKNLNINVLEEKNSYQVSFKTKIAHLDEHEIEKLVKCLSCDKMEEMEEYYWELTGESDTDTELTIVGMMIDKFEISVKDEDIELILYRNKDLR